MEKTAVVEVQHKHFQGGAAEVRIWCNGYGLELPPDLNRAVKSGHWEGTFDGKAVNIARGPGTKSNYIVNLYLDWVNPETVMSSELPDCFKPVLRAMLSFQFKYSIDLSVRSSVPEAIPMSRLSDVIAPVLRKGSNIDSTLQWLRWELTQNKKNNRWFAFLAYLKQVIEGFSLISANSSTYSTMLHSTFVSLYMQYLETASTLAFCDAQLYAPELETRKGVLAGEMGILASRMGIQLNYRLDDRVPMVVYTTSSVRAGTWSIPVGLPNYEP